MGTRPPKALLLLLLLRLLPPRGASAGSLQSPGESRRGEWTEGRTPNSACAPRTRLPSSRGARAGGGGSRTALGGWGEGPGEGQPQSPPSARRPVRVLPGEWRRLPWSSLGGLKGVKPPEAFGAGLRALSWGWAAAWAERRSPLSGPRSHLEGLLVHSLSCLTLCDPVGCSTPGFPVHCLPEFAQTNVH